MKREDFEQISNMVLLGMEGVAKTAAQVFDLCYEGANPGLQRISETVAILHALASPNESQVIIEVGYPFDRVKFWEVVVSLSDSAVGELFKRHDGRTLEDALIVSGRTVTYHLVEKELENETT